jgi:hypothetical protein
MKRAEALMAKSAGLNFADALGQVVRDDPELYQRYAKQDSTAAPSLGSELLSRELDLYGYYSALQATMQGILSSDVAEGTGYSLLFRLDSDMFALLPLCTLI